MNLPIVKEVRAYHTNYAMSRVGLLNDPQQGYQVVSPVGEFVEVANGRKDANEKALELNKLNNITIPERYYTWGLLVREGERVIEIWDTNK